MTTSSNRLILGYELDAWSGCGLKNPMTVDLSQSTNSHILLCGMSGGGKSHLEHLILTRLIFAERDRGGEYFFAGHKGDDTFA